MLTLDYRERSLIPLFPGAAVKQLPVGDAMCEYQNGSLWVAERKTADDLARSLIDGRLVEQKARQLESGAPIFYIIEGDLAQARPTFASLIGVLVNAALKDQITIFRTWHIQETKQLIEQLVKKGEGTGGPAPTLVAKRKRDEDLLLVRILMCIPTISENVARALSDHFGSLGALQQALKTPRDFPSVRISDRAVIGQARVKRLALALA